MANLMREQNNMKCYIIISIIIIIIIIIIEPPKYFSSFKFKVRIEACAGFVI